jgi:hypothetical protein
MLKMRRYASVCEGEGIRSSSTIGDAEQSVDDAT